MVWRNTSCPRPPAIITHKDIKKMLSDKQIIPLCEMWAKKFLRQSMFFNPSRKEAHDALFNIAYSVSKPLNQLNGASTWIMWKLIEYVNERKVDSRAEDYAIHVQRGLKMIDPSKEAEIKEERESLGVALSNLNPSDLALIGLRFGEDKTFREIGGIMKCSRRWVAIKIDRIVEKLREEMRV